MQGERGSAGRPLDGVRILAVEQMQSLPFATQLLAQLGAEVVKVEHPEQGDSGRASLPAVRDVDGRDVGATYLRNNLFKQSLTVDLKRPEGVALLLRMAPRFDVFAENFKAGTLERLGLGVEAVAAAAPRAIYVSVSGFGSGDSPYRSWGAYAPIAESMGGFAHFRSEPGERPRLGGAGALGDLGTALFAAVGILAALRQRERSGRGQHVDVAMYDAMVAMADVVPFFWSMGVRSRSDRVAGIIDVFRARDGWFTVQCVRDHQLAALARALGRAEWLADPRLATRRGWAEQSEALVRPALEAWAADKTRLEACHALNAAGVAAGPCHGPEDVIRDPHLRARRMLLEVARPDGGDPLLVVGNPIKLSDAPERAVERWPALGEHTAAVLRRDAGLSDAEIAELRGKGVV
jgi:formyl-CoA transferase